MSKGVDDQQRLAIMLGGAAFADQEKERRCPSTSSPAPLPAAAAAAAEPASEETAVAEETVTETKSEGDEKTEEKNGREEEEELKSNKVTLADLSAKGTALYVKKKYEESAECFATAAEMQAELNGEMSPDNAEILFLYGRSLFKVGQAQSDVLGGKASSAEKRQKKAPAAEKKKKSKPQQQEQEQEQPEAKAGEAGEASGSKGEEEGEKKGEVEVPGAKKPLFQFTGDENFEDSDEDDAEGGEEEEEEEEDDDLAVAFEILDLARVLYAKKLEQLESGEIKEGEGEPILTHVRERLADTHDLLAEISLENERYPNAITDSRASLNSPRPREQRDEAVKELELAIESTKLKLQGKEVDLATMASPDDNELTRQQITEVKEIIADMEQRLVDLRGPPINLEETLYGDKGIAGSLSGILGAAAGATSAEKQAAIEEAKKTATDLTSLVRKKQKDEAKPPQEAEASNGAKGANGESNGKRKAEDDAEPEELKKAKLEEATA
ncbi:unnamed protein product [Parascedosporium putredinis]|uniref:Tetratricopeptide SHNi-TPR domain-containing protein n=1 Tax=Parascedosporium putredinis TaxID=1442378 RepID=A0A9P1GWX6_9PEZI|nr:unnamed protein product [Parascedosporium putredinis]CAI7990024.1 unnamed protein product [Parascedosporium putredinis]